MAMGYRPLESLISSKQKFAVIQIIQLAQSLMKKTCMLLLILQGNCWILSDEVYFGVNGIESLSFYGFYEKQ